jgi:hypothetical protein
MTQFDASSVVLPEPGNQGITNGREILAFVFAELVKLAGTFGLSLAGLLSPLYLWALHAGGRTALFAVSAGLSTCWGLVMLALFLPIRGLLGGVPALVAGLGRDYAVTTRGGEIGAFALAYVIVIGLVMAMSASLLAPIYVALGPRLAPALGLAISLLSAVVIYAAFVGLRRAILPAAMRQ